MHILITGAGGFVGGHLTAYLQHHHPQATLHGTQMLGSQSILPHTLTVHSIDLRDRAAVIALVRETQPDHIYHLAAQSFVPRSFEDPWDTLENNLHGQLNLIEACIELNLKPRILITGSAVVYGIVQPDEVPVSEDAPLRPNSPYAVSKVAQDMLAYQYHLSHNLPLIRTRSFNHFGPGQSERFVGPAFAMQIARIEAGLQPPIMHVGNLEAQRDYTDVRDILRAYHLLMAQGHPGEVYNVASGQVISAQGILDTLLANSPVTVEIKVDPARLRPAEMPIMYGSYSRLEHDTGWQPQIPIQQSLMDILEDCRQRVKAEQQ